jgi:hypothetical protein
VTLKKKKGMVGADWDMYMCIVSLCFSNVCTLEDDQITLITLFLAPQSWLIIVQVGARHGKYRGGKNAKLQYRQASATTPAPLLGSSIR